MADEDLNMPSYDNPNTDDKPAGAEPEAPVNDAITSAALANVAIQPETAHNQPLLAASVPEGSTVGRHGHGRKLLYGGAALINLGLLAGSISLWRISPRQPKVNSPSDISVQVAAPTGQITASATAETPTIKHYASDPMKLEFDYPSDWRIESNPDNTYITIQSAPFNVKTVDDKTTKVQANIRIYNKYPESSFDVNDQSIVTANSEKLVYKNPTKVQRTETNLTYARDPSISDRSVTSAVFVSSDQSYVIGQNVGAKNYRKTNPFLVFKVSPCTADNCGSFDDAAQISAQTIQSLAAFQATKDVIASMRFME